MCVVLPTIFIKVLAQLVKPAKSVMQIVIILARVGALVG
jgi:hypothetical protein